MKNKKLILSIIAVVALILITIGVTYAYWVITREQENENLITLRCLDIDITAEENEITLSNQYPLTDTQGKALTPFTFTVTNKCDSEVDYRIQLEAIETEIESMLTSSIKVMLDSNTPQVLGSLTSADTTINGAFESHVIGFGTLAQSSDTTNSSASHEVRIWIDEDAPVSEANKGFFSKVSVSVGQGIDINELEEGTLAYDIVSNYGGVDSITVKDDFSTKSASSEAALHVATDDLGDSYYFRGRVTNNYVKFGTWAETYTEIRGYSSEAKSYAKKYASLDECNAATSYNISCEEVTVANAGDPMYWRIIRVNGDGTIRMIYDGTTAVDNKTSHVASIGVSAFNTSIDDPKYLGYTYNVDGIETDSTVKTMVDDWYETNLKTTYGNYIADGIFCNNKNIINNNYEEYTSIYQNNTPMLTCTREADKYSIDNKIGNALLENPVGLITFSEAVMAGGVLTYANQYYYLYSNEPTFTMTPGSYATSGARGVYIWAGGYMGGDKVNFEANVRPVINLKADVAFTGEGTYTAPYEITMN